jgi:dethiobiotin synthetase
LGILKPIQTGTGDRELYQKLFDLNQLPEEITPLHFQTPLAPPVAAEREGRPVNLSVVWQAFEALRQKRQVVLVVPVKLGAIAQAVANVALARQSGVHLKGIVLNCVQACSDEEIADWTPIDMIQSLTNVPVLGVLHHLADPTDLTKLAQVASNLDLERLLSL